MREIKTTRSLMYARQRSTDGAFAVRPVRFVSKKKFRTNRSRIFSFSVFATTVLLAVTFGNIGDTVSYFSDNDRSSGNVFHAGELDFTVSADGSVDASVGSEESGGAVIIPILSPSPGSFPLTYRVSAEKIAGPDAFCNALEALATTSPFIYSGPLLSLATGATTVTGPWSLTLFLPPGAPGVSQGDLCFVDLVYRGWRDGAQEGEGYQDKETIHLTLHALVEAFGIESFQPEVSRSLFFSDSSLSASSTDSTSSDIVSDTIATPEATTTDATVTEDPAVVPAPTTTESVENPEPVSQDEATEEGNGEGTHIESVEPPTVEEPADEQAEEVIEQTTEQTEPTAVQENPVETVVVEETPAPAPVPEPVIEAVAPVQESQPEPPAEPPVS